MNLFWPLLAAVLAAAGFGIFRTGLTLRSETCARRLVIVFTATVFLIYFLLGWWKYGAFQFGLWDFGIYDSLLRSTAAGEGIMRDFRGDLYDHFSPLVLLLVPFYLLCDTPMNLIWFQSAAMAAGIPLMYSLALRYCRKTETAFALALLYALNPYYSRLVLYDFHLECLFPAMFIGGFLARAYGRRRLALALWITCCLVKEDFVVPIAALGLFFLFERSERKNGFILLAWSFFITFFVLKIYFPLFSEKGYWHYDRYDLFAPTLAETAKNVWAMAKRVCRADSLEVLLSVILPFALLPLGHGKMFVFVLLPTLGVQLASTSGHQHFLFSHYSSALIGVVPVAALWGARVLRIRISDGNKPDEPQMRRAALFILIFGGAFHVGYCDLPLTRYYSSCFRWENKNHFGVLSLPLRPSYYEEMLQKEIRGEELRRVFPLIPPGSRVAIQNELGLPLLRTHKLYTLPGPEDADYVLFDHALYTGSDYIPELNRCITRCIRDPRYELIFRKNGILLFARRPASGRKIP